MVVIEMVKDCCLANMGQKQGQAGQFIFYTFDNENKLLSPHIHICVLSDNESFDKGIVSNINSNIKTLATIRIRANSIYSISNIQLLEVFDEKIKNQQFLESIIIWLNTPVIKDIPQYTYANKCLIDYALSNKVFSHKTEYMKILRQYLT